MSILALDLSTQNCGFAEFSNDGALLNFGNIIPDQKLHLFQKIKYVTDQLEELIKRNDVVVIEDIYLAVFNGFRNVVGFVALARLSGAVINAWIQKHDILPVLYKATEARKLVKIKGTCQKCEVQIWVIKNFRVVQNNIEKELDDWDAMIEACYAELGTKEVSRETFKKRMEKISKMIEEVTGIDENQADAILLGKAILNDQNQRINKNNQNS